jgi:hypothetical protein
VGAHYKARGLASAGTVAPEVQAFRWCGSVEHPEAGPDDCPDDAPTLLRRHLASGEPETRRRRRAAAAPPPR